MGTLRLYYLNVIGLDVISWGRGIKDDFGFTLVNFNRLISTGLYVSNELFILVSQAKQVFYIEAPMDKGWWVFITIKPQDLYEISDNGLHDHLEDYFESGLYNGERTEDDLIAFDM